MNFGWLDSLGWTILGDVRIMSAGGSLYTCRLSRAATYSEETDRGSIHSDTRVRVSITQYSLV